MTSGLTARSAVTGMEGSITKQATDARDARLLYAYTPALKTTTQSTTTSNIGALLRADKRTFKVYEHYYDTYFAGFTIPMQHRSI